MHALSRSTGVQDSRNSLFFLQDARIKLKSKACIFGYKARIMQLEKQIIDRGHFRLQSKCDQIFLRILYYKLHTYDSLAEFFRNFAIRKMDLKTMIISSSLYFSNPLIDFVRTIMLNRDFHTLHFSFRSMEIMVRVAKLHEIYRNCIQVNPLVGNWVTAHNNDFYLFIISSFKKRTRGIVCNL